jgi:hypothetical protein
MLVLERQQHADRTRRKRGFQFRPGLVGLHVGVQRFQLRDGFGFEFWLELQLREQFGEQFELGFVRFELRVFVFEFWLVRQLRKLGIVGCLGDVYGG